MPHSTLTTLALLPTLLSLSVTPGPLAAPRPPPDPPRTIHHSATTGDGRVWPVPRPRIVRGWTPPASPYGPGHRGVDLAAPPGTEVRAAGSGRISFAGRIAGRGVLSLTLDGTGDPPLRITYEPVDALHPTGTRVTAGRPVARLSAAPLHCPAPCLHWGLLRARDYLDPLSLLHRPPPRLLPLTPPPPSRTGDPRNERNEGNDMRR
ncbi:M23 family metallopeptidase [Streptomyces qinzhouensis]|uniref:M23 family metallopeptidase n=1 Tax=Streptomyces qinzhouensis TaxID=2599401 RepID=A0A5B8JNN8_9ACTN|nr:M23 family metallopeptidase [Streptomyces qinzhouensis]QDY79253.1 M23 family metallopeptidase [Streptomyces qinzhouensis]